MQSNLKSLLQHHSSKVSILWCSTFFIIQLSHPYMTTGKTITLTRQTFVGQLKSLLFNILSRMVIVFLPRSKHLLISWLQSTSAVILESPNIKSINSLAFILLTFQQHLVLLSTLSLRFYSLASWGVTISWCPCSSRTIPTQ